MARHRGADSEDGGSENDDSLAERLDRVARRPGFFVGLALGVLVSVATALLVVQNSHTVELELAWFDFDAPMWLMLVLTLAAGAVIAELVRLWLREYRARSGERRSTLSAVRRRLGRTNGGRVATGAR